MAYNIYIYVYAQISNIAAPREPLQNRTFTPAKQYFRMYIIFIYDLDIPVYIRL